MREFNPTFLPPNPVTCVPGHSAILVATINDPAVTPVVLRLDGVEVEVSLTQRGAVCWTGSVSLAGYSWPDRHTWDVSQGENSDSGSFMGLPGERDAYAFVHGSCDNASGATSGRIDTAAATWPNVYASVQSSPVPVAGLFFVDDLGYVDAKYVDDSEGSGLVSTGAPQATLELDDYLIAWCCFLGMLGYDGDWIDMDHTDVNQRRIIYPREFHRAWCRKNLNWWPNWGDHEFANDMGWDGGTLQNHLGQVLDPYGPSQSGNNPRWTTYPTVEGPGAVAYKAVIGLLQPPYTGARDTVANHWVTKIGCAAFVTLDPITHNDTTATYTATGDEPTELMDVQITTMHGNDQIDDVLESIAEARPALTFIALVNGVRYTLDDVRGAFPNGVSEFHAGGTQHPIYNHCIAEFRRIFTATGNSPQSLMDSKWTNGANGSLCLLGGDYHRGNVSRFKRAAYAGNRQEEFLCVTTGTLGGTTNFFHPLGPENSDEREAADVVVEAITDPWGHETAPPHFWHTFVVVRGDLSPVRADIAMHDLDGEVVWSGSLHQFGGNLPRESAPAFASGISVETDN